MMVNQLQKLSRSKITGEPYDAKVSRTVRGRLTEKCSYTRVTRRLPILPIWLATIAPYGYTQQQIQYDPCINVLVGTWILSREIAESQNYWQGVGNYHSHTLTFNQRYEQQVHARLNLLNHYLTDTNAS